MLYTFPVISFAQYKEYMTCLVSFSKFSDVIPAFTCVEAASNLWSISLGVNIFNSFPCFSFTGSIPLLTELTANYEVSSRAYALS